MELEELVVKASTFRTRKTSEITDVEVSLSLKYLKGELAISQIGKVLGFQYLAMALRILKCLRVAYNKGLIDVK